MNKSISVPGARWSALAAGIKQAAADAAAVPDLALLELCAGSTLAAVFTRNAFRAAPVELAEQRVASLSTSAASYCLINAGNANAGTGSHGMQAALASSAAVAGALSVAPEQVLPFSTGVIGEPLPVDCFERHAEALVAGLDAAKWPEAAAAIMTTDTRPKIAERSLQIAGQTLTLSGIAKGAGMIKPNMATMLAFIACDAAVAKPDLEAVLANAVGRSFNRITVDGDTSTNDACVLAATGASGITLSPAHESWSSFVVLVDELLLELAQAIIRDAEGATKFVELRVSGGASSQECLQVAYTVAESPLVKTALFASDANWGRILAAVGRAGIRELDVNRVAIGLDDYLICANGGRVADYSEARASAIMARDEILVTIELARGDCCESVWTSDLSHDYVRINADYRS